MDAIIVRGVHFKAFALLSLHTSEGVITLAP
jgi:hypothetical protein